MAQAMTEPKKHLALDTDWLTALNVSFGLLFSILAAVGMTWSLLHTAIKAVSPSWSSPFLAVLLIYVAVKDSNKVFRASLIILAVSPISHIVLWLFRASTETRVLNEVFIRCSWIGLCFVGCLYAIYWLSSKFKYV
jgi:multisubunit Na+/H+ antiporter MnhG subunit